MQRITRKLGRLTMAALVVTAMTPPLVIPTTPAQAYTQNGCVSLQVNGSSFMVVNSCPHSVIGKFCFLSGDYLNCQNRDFGGFGPIKSGGSEGTAKSAREYTEWRVSYCNYDDWNGGQCSIGDPY